MSLINDALIKAERDRAEIALAESQRLTPRARAEKRRETRRAQSLPLIALNAGVLMALFAVVIIVLHRNRDAVTERAVDRDAPSTLVHDANSEASLAAASSPATGAEASPFVPSAASAPAVTAAPDNGYALAGMSAIGDTTLLSITRLRDQRSVWVPVGKTVGEITAIRYDSSADRAVIRVNGRELTIGLRTPSAEPSAQAAE